MYASCEWIVVPPVVSSKVMVTCGAELLRVPDPLNILLADGDPQVTVCEGTVSVFILVRLK